MSIDYRIYPQGQTLDRGRFVFRELLGGARREGLWSGEQLEPDRRRVVISFMSTQLSEQLESLLHCEVSGLASLLFVGSPDEYAPPKVQTRSRDLAVVEARPQGCPLADAGQLTPQEALRLGLGLCDTIREWADQARITCGLRPETVYVVDEPGGRQFAGATPRAYLFLGNYFRYGKFSPEPYDPPTPNWVMDVAPDDALFTVALLIWFALLGEHAYDLPEHPDIHNNIWEDVRRPVTGPPELGRILEAVLMSDFEKRMKTDEFRSELVKLARAWNVELPPFPPPGLAAA